MAEHDTIIIEELDELETLVAVHGTAHCLESTGHICFSIAAAVGSIHSY